MHIEDRGGSHSEEMWQDIADSDSALIVRREKTPLFLFEDEEVQQGKLSADVLFRNHISVSEQALRCKNNQMQQQIRGSEAFDMGSSKQSLFCSLMWAVQDCLFCLGGRVM